MNEKKSDNLHARRTKDKTNRNMGKLLKVICEVVRVRICKPCWPVYGMHFLHVIGIKLLKFVKNRVEVGL